jgi:hypothetical protein
MHRARSSLSKNRQSVLPDPGKQNCQQDKASLKRDNAPNSDGVTARSKKRIAPEQVLILAAHFAGAHGSYPGCSFFTAVFLWSRKV